MRPVTTLKELAHALRLRDVRIEIQWTRHGWEVSVRRFRARKWLFQGGALELERAVLEAIREWDRCNGPIDKSVPEKP